MNRSSERFLTTHTGSLPRPDYLVGLVNASADVSRDVEARQEAIAKAVSETVRMQVDNGVTVVNDGEMGKESYSTYVRQRLSGFDGEGAQSIACPTWPSTPAIWNVSWPRWQTSAA